MSALFRRALFCRPLFGRAALVFSLLLSGSVFCALEAQGASSVGGYIVPHLGYSWNRFFVLEIERSFISSADDDSGDGTGADGHPAVGSKAQFKGGGFAVGVGGGIRLFDLKIGVLYLHSSSNVEGFEKNYEYSPDRGRAVGENEQKTGGVDLHRVLADFHYSIPFYRFAVDLKTRIGAIMLRNSNLDTLHEGKGFTGDIGLGFSVFFLEFLSVGLDGYIGFFSFPGDYSGVYGIVSGLGASVQVAI